MMKTFFVFALIALAAAQTCSDNVQNGNEEGVDCGTGCTTPCTCQTDLTRAIEPPTLINDNINFTSGAETGIEGQLLRVALTVDPIVELAANAAPLRGGTSLYNSVAYIAPTITWIATPAQFGTGTAGVIGTCPDSSLDTVVTSFSTGVADLFEGIRGANFGDATGYGTLGAGCAAQRSTLSAWFGINNVISECGFATDVSQANQAGSLTPPVDGTATDPDPLSGLFTLFTGTFELHTSQYGGFLSGAAEVAFRLESAFRIQIQIQETVGVVSDNIQVIGAATNQSAITHQIWDTDNSRVDINALIGTSYPTGPSIFGPATTMDSADTAAFVPSQLVKLQNSFCAARTTAIPVTTTIDACVAAAYATSDSYCEVTGTPAGCEITDFFSSIEVTQGSIQGTRDGTGAATSTPPPDFAAQSDNSAQVLPDTTGLCPATDGAGQDADACLSNIHIRLVPRTGWCDLNFPLRLLVGVVCRDDLNGDNTNDDSMIPDGLFDTTSTTSTGFSTAGFTCTTGTLPSTAPFNFVTDGATGGGGIDFSIASDNFCARTVYTASLTGAASVYEADDWGAECTGGATTCEAAGTSFNLASCNAGTTDGTALFGLCRASPGLFADSLTGGTQTARKSQNTFVFGQTMYFETRVTAEAGVNIDTTTITELWTTSDSITTFPTTVVANGDSPTTATWAQQLYNAGAAVPIVGYQSGTAVTGSVAVTNDLATEDLSGYTIVYTGGNSAVTNDAGSDAARLGENFQGVSRATIVANDATIFTVNLQTTAEGTTIWARIAVTYEGANNQGPLADRSVETMSNIPAGMTNRARLLQNGGPQTGITGGNAQVGVRAGSSSGSAGGASTIAGFSSTTVLAAAVVLGAVVAVAAAGFFVQRNRAQPQSKRTSSSLELNDAAMTQA